MTPSPTPATRCWPTSSSATRCAGCSPATTPSGATTPPSWPTASAGSRWCRRCVDDLPALTARVRRAGRRHRRRARDGHGRLEPVPRGARPHLRAGARAALASTCSTPPTPPPSRASATRARRSARCTWRRRSRAPRSRRAATSSGRGSGPPAPAASPSSPTPAPSSARSPRERGFADVFENRPDIGGRYSALSLFGVVPGLLMGVDVGRAPRRAASTRLARSAARTSTRRENPALQLAATHGGRRAQSGHDKATFVPRPRPGDDGAVDRAARRRVAGQGRHRRRARSSASRSGAPAVYGDDRVFLAQVPIDDLEAAGHPALVGGSDVSPQRARPDGRRPGAGRRPHRRGHRRAALRPARRRRGQGRDQRGARRGRAPTSPVQPLADLLAHGAAGRPPRPPGVRRPGRPRGPRARGRARRAARPAPGGGQPGLRAAVPALHRAAPQGRARRPSCACRRSGRRPTRSRSPAGPSASATSKQAQAAGDLRTLRARGIRAGRVDLHELLEVAT